MTDKKTKLSVVEGSLNSDQELAKRVKVAADILAGLMDQAKKAGIVINLNLGEDPESKAVVVANFSAVRVNTIEVQ